MAMFPEEVIKKSQAIVDRLWVAIQLSQLKDPMPLKAVSSYLSINNEPVLDELNCRIARDGGVLAIPQVQTDDTLVPVHFYPDRNYLVTKYGNPITNYPLEPLPNWMEVGIVIVPGLAFDASGNRVGYGKGHLDRYLKDRRSIKIGVCYDYQVLDSVPQDDHDVQMDLVITDERTIHVRSLRPAE
jgi:5-formyltetrahydrofolate cyclo-ligase